MGESFNMKLTKPQNLIMNMEKFAGGSISIICGSMLIEKEYAISELRNAVNELFRLNDAFRISINESDTGVQQYISDYIEPEHVEILHFDSKKELDQYAERYAKIPISITDVLFEAKIIILPGRTGLLCKLHHLVGDAWTLSLIGTQFNAILNGETVQSGSYVDYIESEKNYLLGKRYSKDRDFFVEQFNKCNDITYMSEKANHTFEAERKTFVICSKDVAIINNYIALHNTSAFMLFMSALAIYINRTKMNTEKFYIGTAVINRATKSEKNTAGMFINMVPILIELDNNADFITNYSNIEAGLFSILRHQKFNYTDVLSTLRSNCEGVEKLYDVLLSYQNASVVGENIETTWYHCGMQTESLQIHIDDRDNEGIYRIHYDYLVEKFSENDILMLHQHIMNLLFDAIANENKMLYELNILSSSERQKLLYNFNNTAVSYSKNKCVHQLFEEQAENHPNEIAVVACDKILTYHELNEEANKIAHSLIEKGICVGDKVSYSLTRKSHLFSAIMGILKSGAAYIPIAPDYPSDRISFMNEDSQAKFCITEDNIYALLSNPISTNPNVNISSEDLCYCIYTSGSTGTPKGVMIRHRNITNFVHENKYNVVCANFSHKEKSIAAIDTCSFDIFKTESLLPLCDGFTIVLADETESKDPKEFSKLMRQHPVDILQTTPTKLQMLISDNKYIDYLKNAKVIIVGGEALELSFLHELRQKTDARIYNNYGPTETTVWSSLAEIASDDIHIGKPIANTQIYITDQFMQLVPMGIVGELCIAGDGVGAGYLNRPEQTAEKFIDNPFGAGKLYKTGDLAYWREDGNIVYVGRNDFQVKIRGLRIELGEIENEMMSMKGIHQAVVIVRKNNEERQLICAFYTGEKIDSKEIRNYIGKKLPKYMLPHIFTHIDEMPLTSSSKINRKALPEVDLYANEIAAEYVAPETHMQKELCNLIQVILGTSLVGIEDDFFDIGGDSLKAVEYVTKAHNEGIYFSLQNVFDFPTVKGLCECIESEDDEKISYADIDFTNINMVLAKNNVENIVTPKRCDVGNILLAGSTGYLGIHVLADFLDNDSGMAYCLVRGKSQGEAESRFAALLNFYFKDKYDNSNRITVVCADLQKDLFGLAEEQYTALLEKIHTVINCAASVKHYGSYEYFYDVNVQTTKRLIEFCKKAQAKLIHTSTMSVSGNSFGDDFGVSNAIEEINFSECTLYLGQPLNNVYARSKFEAEKLVLEAISSGLSANIMRMGQLSNRASDGLFQINYEKNAYLKRIKAILDIGAVPDYLTGIYTEFTPVDEAARAIMTITRHFSSEHTVFHIENHKFVYLNELIKIFGKLGYHIDIVSHSKFSDLIRSATNDESKRHIFEAFINEMDENDRLNYDSKIRIHMRFTLAYLRMLGFEWSDIDVNYMEKYMNYFIKIGLFKK